MATNNQTIYIKSHYGPIPVKINSSNFSLDTIKAGILEFFAEKQAKIAIELEKTTNNLRKIADNEFRLVNRGEEVTNFSSLEYSNFTGGDGSFFLVIPQNGGYKKSIGSRSEVLRGVAKKTSGGLVKKDLKKIKNKIYSKKEIKRRNL